MVFIALKTEDGVIKGKIFSTALLKQSEGVRIPGERTVYRIMEEIGLSHHPKRRPNGITKADSKACRSDDLLKRDFTSAEPLKKCITDITEIKAMDGKLYVSAEFDCFDAAVLGLAMDKNMKASLCRQTLENAVRSYPALRGAVIHSDRGTQYTSGIYRKAVRKYGILQNIVDVTLPEDYELDTGALQKNLCQECLDKVAESLEYWKWEDEERSGSALSRRF